MCDHIGNRSIVDLRSSQLDNHKFLVREPPYENAPQPDEVDHVNAHGTSTPIGDVIETTAMKRLFGERATSKKLPVSSTKSMTGHLLGGAGGLEAGISALALRDQLLPPTINQFNPDPQCDLDYVPNQARKLTVDYALSNSFGFGGTNAALIFKRWTGQ